MPGFIKPFGLILLRVAIAGIFFWGISPIFRKEKIASSDWPRLALCALFGVVTNQLMFFKGLSITSPINASIIMISTPILVLLFSALLLKEIMTLRKIVGIIIGALGAFLIIGGHNFAFNSTNLTGDLYVLINAVSYAMYLIIVKPLMGKYHPITVIKWIFFFGFFPVLLFGWQDLAVVDWSTLDLGKSLAILYVIGLATCLAYIININALRSVTPSTIAIFIYLQPILASVIAIILSQDTLTLNKVISCACVILGVYLVTAPSTQKEVSSS